VQLSPNTLLQLTVNQCHISNKVPHVILEHGPQIAHLAIEDIGRRGGPDRDHAEGECGGDERPPPREPLAPGAALLVELGVICVVQF
jgi:hypothetical protein